MRNNGKKLVRLLVAALLALAMTLSLAHHLSLYEEDFEAWRKL